MSATTESQDAPASLHLTLPAVGRESIDQWPIDETGLPIRVLRCARENNLRHLGDLRKRLATLPGLGTASKKQTAIFLHQCDQLAQGQLIFSDIHELLATFLDERALRIIEARYSLTGNELSATGHSDSLQQVANRENLTRERVRQLQDKALALLSTRLIQASLESAYCWAEALLKKNDHVIECADLTPYWQHKALGPYNPCRVLMLLADLNPQRIQYWNELFLIPRSPSELRDISHKADTALSKADKPLSAEQLAKAVARPNLPPRLTFLLASRLEKICRTLDDRLFQNAEAAIAFMAELPQENNNGTHYRTLARTHNARLTPATRPGSGTYLTWLRTSTHTRQTDFGLYVLLSD